MFNIDTLRIPNLYFQLLNLISDYNKNDVSDKILDVWKKIKAIGEKHINIGAQSSTYESDLLMIENIHIETFSKYVHFIINFMNLIFGCIQR
jgi:hypothetical protein